MVHAPELGHLPLPAERARWAGSDVPGGPVEVDRAELYGKYVMPWAARIVTLQDAAIFGKQVPNYRRPADARADKSVLPTPPA